MNDRKPNRTAEQQIADLQAEIEAIRIRDQRKRARANPATRLAIAAVKTLDKALSEATDPTMKGALQEARVTVAAAVATTGVVLAPSMKKAKAPGRKLRPA